MFRMRQLGKMAYALGTLGIVVGFAACSPSKKKETASPAPESVSGESADEESGTGEANRAAVFAAFEGMLPCVDCEGIRVDLTLFAEKDAYQLEETYLHTKDGDRTESSAGTWSITRGTPEDSSATLVSLTPAGTGTSRYFLWANDRDLRVMDSPTSLPANEAPVLTRKVMSAGPL